MRDLDPGASPLAFFGSEVRRARTAAGMTLAELGALVPCDASTVSRIEAGEREPTGRFAAVCDEAFAQMGGWFMRYYKGSRTWNGPYPPWFRDWVEAEQRATVVRWWEPLLIPGLLQTPEYARAVLGWGPDNRGDVEAKVAARIERQGILDREVPAELWMLLDQSVLSRCVGSADTMRGQIKHLEEISALPHVTIQVVPESAGAYGGLSGAFAIAISASSDTVVYVETGVQGMTVHEPKMIARATFVFDHLRAEALPRAQTLELLTRAGERWNE